MLKKLAILLSPDAIEDGGSGGAESRPAIEEAAETTNQSLNEFVAEHVKGYVAPEKDDMLGEHSPSEEEDDEKIKGRSDSENELDKKKEEVEKKEGETEEKEEKSEEKVEETEEKKEGEEQKEESLPEGKPVPYERFQEVARERTSFKAEVERNQPVVDNYNRITRFCQDYSITPEQFEKAMRVQALLNTNPSEALKELAPIMESLQGYIGDKLPVDLQKKVDDGRMELSDAREMAKMRAHNEFREKSFENREAARVRRENEAAIAATTKAATDWEIDKRKNDPDYKPSSNGVDGLWEDVRDKFIALLNQRDPKGDFVNPVHTPQQMVELQSRAYKLVKEKWTKYLGGGTKPATRKRLSSNGAGGGAREAMTEENAPTMKEAINIRLQKSGAR